MSSKKKNNVKYLTVKKQLCTVTFEKALSVDIKGPWYLDFIGYLLRCDTAILFKDVNLII